MYQERGKEQKRHSNDLLFGVENGLKVYKGRQAALADKVFYGLLAKNEQDFRAKVKARPELEKQFGQAWDTIAGLVKKQQQYRKEYNALERGPISDLFNIARGYVRFAEESGSPTASASRSSATPASPSSSRACWPTSHLRRVRDRHAVLVADQAA